MRVKEIAVVAIDTKIVATDCANCGIVFGITEEYRTQRRKDGRTFYCPNGHSLTYAVEKSEREAELERQLRREKERASFNERLEQEERGRRVAAERSAAAYKGVATRQRNRIARGVCPCCNRYFADLHRHMESKHPDFKDGESAA